MRAVEIPAGLRDRLFVAASVQRGTRLRRRAGQYAALAASLFLIIGLAAGIFTATRPEPNIYALVENAERIEPTLFNPNLNPVGFGFDRAQASQNSLDAWLKDERLPALPEPEGNTFDPSLIVSQHTEDVQGRDVPVLLLRGRDGSFAKIYAFRSTQFNVKNLEGGKGLSSSNCQARFFSTHKPGVVYVVVFSGPSLMPFVKQQAGNGGVAHAA